jgi:predicted  nucleic acid-binding Zn-ribbon protein
MASKIQKKYLKNGCPECGGKMHEVDATEADEETGYVETYLWCNECFVSMDEDGGYTK